MCEECGASLGGWKLIHEQFSHLCGDCIAEGIGTLCNETGHYRLEQYCLGYGCEQKGVPNYMSEFYYCGGSPKCCP